MISSGLFESCLNGRENSIKEGSRLVATVESGGVSSISCCFASDAAKSFSKTSCRLQKCLEEIEEDVSVVSNTNCKIGSRN